MILLLDSDIVIHLLRDHPPTVKAVRKAALSVEQLAISVITAAEVYAGMRSYEATATKGLLEQIHQFSVNPAIARRAGELKNALARKGRSVELADMLIAATALLNDCELMTLNLKDFKATGVTFYGAGEN